MYTLEKIIVFITFYLIFRNLFIYEITINWDAIDYMWIAAHGYMVKFLYAFSPVFPALIKGLTFLTGSYSLSSLIITNIFVILSYNYYGFKGSIILSTFPVFVIYSTIPYSDDIALTFLILSLNLGGWLSAIALGGAIATFYNLAYTLPSFILKYKRKIWYFLPPLAAGGAILLAFWIFTGSPFTFFSVESKHWSAYFTTPWCQAEWILNCYSFFINSFFDPYFHLSPLVYLLRNYVFLAFYITGTILFYKKSKDVFLTLYSLSIILPLFFIHGWPSISLPRLLLPAFPSLLGYVEVIFKRKAYTVIYIAISFFLTFFFTEWQVLAFFA
ncbi:hypothetical protein D1867_07855 [Acidianus infernus]|uniref:Glycosyltransferase RgtA/B/C/D-like domain-containing protein n=1 Tax=Acidianus infernus TaxID=12915 RepID=A0A6A9QPM0_ACIIN|nr:hypothetical protein [Acidianus infernus]MUM65147.1 hypothetical protein [Acidianus infernus]